MYVVNTYKINLMSIKVTHVYSRNNSTHETQTASHT